MQSILASGASAFRLNFPTFIPRRYRPGNLGTWSGHLAFAADLVAALQPATIVELGTHYGESYFAFCQSVVENGIPCQCYAVDHWQGEAHAGFYGEDVFAEVSAYNQANYASFSHLLRMSFEQARERFPDSSIDLLHIDGLHTYEAVRHDFESWYPKLREGGIVLLHDVAARHADFGVWRFWEQLSAKFPESFAFEHSSGLGVIRKPGTERQANEFLDALFDNHPEAQEQFRQRYVIYSSHLEHVFEQQRNQTKTLWTSVQIYWSVDGAYSEAASTSQAASSGSLQHLTFILPAGTGNGPLRIDPADCPCAIEFRSITVSDERTGKTLWQREGSDIGQLRAGGSAVALAGSDSFYLFSYGDDPQLLLPSLSEHKERVVVTIELRLHRTLEAVANFLQGAHQRSTTSVRIFPAHGGAYSESQSIKAEAVVGEWQTIAMALPPGTNVNALRIDPGELPGAIEIREIVVRRSGQTVWVAREPRDLRRLELSNATVAPRADKYILLSASGDPQLRLMPAAAEEADSVEITLRIDTSPEALAEVLAAPGAPACTTQRGSESWNLADERSRAAAQISQIATERNNLQRELRDFTASVRAREEARLADPASLETLQRSRDALAEQLGAERGVRDQLEHSLSWRLTKPLRALNSLRKRR